jgi:hypothetical protein
MTENNTSPEQPKRAVTVTIYEGGIMRPEQVTLASGGRVTIQLDEKSESQCITITYPDGKSALLTKLDHPNESFTWEHRHGLGKHVFESSLWSFAKTTLEVVANNKTTSDIECETHEVFDAQIHFPSLLKPRKDANGQSQSPTDNRHRSQPSLYRPSAAKAPFSLLSVSTPKTGNGPSPHITDNATKTTLGRLASPSAEDPAPVAERVCVDNRKTQTSTSSLATPPPGGYFLPHKKPLVIDTDMDSFTDNNDYHFYGSSKGNVMHSCARCKQQFVSELNARRCLALHAGIRVTPSSSAGVSLSPKSREDFQALVTYWNSADLATKIAILNIGQGNEAGRGLASRVKAAAIGLECSSPFTFTSKADKMLQDAASLTDVCDLLLCFADSCGHSPFSEASGREPDSPPYCQDGYHVISLLNTTLEGLINLIPPAMVSSSPSSSASQKVRKNAIDNTKLEKKAAILAAGGTRTTPITPTMAGIRADLAAEYGAMVLGQLTKSRFDYLEGQAKMMMTNLLVEEGAAAHAAGITNINKKVLEVMRDQFVSTAATTNNNKKKKKKKKKKNKGKKEKQTIEASVSSSGTSTPVPSSLSSALSTSPAAYADSNNDKNNTAFYLRDNPFFIPDKEEEEAAAPVSIEQLGAKLTNSNTKETLIPAVCGANAYGDKTEKNHNSNNNSNNNSSSSSSSSSSNNNNNKRTTIMDNGKITKHGITIPLPPPPPPPKVTAPVIVSYAAMVKDGTSRPSSASSSPAAAPIPAPLVPLAPAANKSTIITINKKKETVPSGAPSLSSSSSSSPAKASHPPLSPSPTPTMHRHQQQQRVETRSSNNNDTNVPLQGTPQPQHAPPFSHAPYHAVPHARYIEHHYQQPYGPLYPPPPPHYWAHPVYFGSNHHPEMLAPQSSSVSPSPPPGTDEASPPPPPRVSMINGYAMQPPPPIYQHLPPMYYSPCPSPPPPPPHHYQHHPQYMFHPGAPYYPQGWVAMPPPSPSPRAAAAASAAACDGGEEEQVQVKLEVREEMKDEKGKEPPIVMVAATPAIIKQNISPKPADCTIEDATTAHITIITTTTTSPVTALTDEKPREGEEMKEEEKVLTDEQPQEEGEEMKERGKEEEEDIALLEALLDPNTMVLECSDRASFFYGLMKDAREEAGLTELAAQAACMEEKAREREEARVVGSRNSHTSAEKSVNAAVSPPLSEEEEEVEEAVMERTSFVTLLTCAVVKQRTNAENAAKSNKQQKAQQEALAKPSPAGTLLPTIAVGEGRGRGGRRSRRNRGRGRGRNNNNNTNNDNDIKNDINEKSNDNAGTSNDSNKNSWLIAAKRAM